MKRRGFTLLELLITIGLVLGLGALVWPAMVKFQRGRIFDSAVEIVRDQLLLARAHAQASGKPVEVIYLNDPPRIEARMFEPILRAMQENGSGIVASADQIDDLSTIELDDEELEESLIPDPWALRIIADRIHLSTKPQVSSEDVMSGSFDDFDYLQAEDLFDLEQEQQPQTIRLAIFLSDGSALLGDPVWIIDADGRQGRIAVNPWTGIAGYEQSSVYQSDFDSLDEDEEEFEDLLEEDPVDDQSPPPVTEPSQPENDPDDPSGEEGDS